MSFEQVFMTAVCSNPLGFVSHFVIPTAAHTAIFGPVAGTYTYVMIIPNPNYPGTYQMDGGNIGETGTRCAGPCLFPCVGPGGASPSFGFTPSLANWDWTIIYI